MEEKKTGGLGVGWAGPFHSGVGLSFSGLRWPFLLGWPFLLLGGGRPLFSGRGLALPFRRGGWPFGLGVGPSVLGLGIGQISAFPRADENKTGLALGVGVGIWGWGWPFLLGVWVALPVALPFLGLGFALPFLGRGWPFRSGLARPDPEGEEKVRRG